MAKADWNDIGPTGRFPQGKVSPNDQGELCAGLTISNGKIILGFGKEVAWLAMNADQAEELAELLTKYAGELRSRN